MVRRKNPVYIFFITIMVRFLKEQIHFSFLTINPFLDILFIFSYLYGMKTYSKYIILFPYHKTIFGLIILFSLP